MIQSILCFFGFHGPYKVFFTSRINRVCKHCGKCHELSHLGKWEDGGWYIETPETKIKDENIYDPTRNTTIFEANRVINKDSKGVVTITQYPD